MSSKSKKIVAAILLVVMAVVVTLVASFAVDHTNGATRVAERFVASFNEKDFDSFCSCFMPADQETLKKAADAIGGGDAFFDKNKASMFEGKTGFSDFGENITLSMSEIETKGQTITDGQYNGIDMASMDVSSVATVNCVITTKGSLKEQAEKIVFVCVKVKGSWYLYTMSAVTPDASATDVTA
jgi:hypothetical protein